MSPAYPAGIAHADNGLQHVSSSYSFPKTIALLEQAIREHGLTLFAQIHFTADAAKVGLEMQPSELLLFGSPKAGTPLMVASPTLAIDLPLKILVWEDTQHQVWITYDQPEYLQQRHSVPTDLVKNISGVAALVHAAVAQRAA